MYKTGMKLLLTATLLGIGQFAHAQDGAGFQFQEGPSVGDLGGIAQINVPQGYIFAGPDDTRTIMEAMQNPVSGTEVGFIGPAGQDWFVVFEYDEVGYVKDDEKASLDAQAMLTSIRRGNDASNKQRSKRGWATIDIVGWEQPPRYDEASHNLEWAVRAQSEGDFIVNYNTRLLGRGGVMRVTLVTDPATLPQILPDFRGVLQGYGFNAGQTYAEYRQGDKLAKYGLTALVVGGASAVALKSGLFKFIWKGLVVAFVAVGAFVKKLFSRSNA